METIVSEIPLLLMLAAIGIALRSQYGEKTWLKPFLFVLGGLLVVRAGTALLPIETIWPVVFVLALVTIVASMLRGVYRKQMSWKRFPLTLCLIFVSVAGMIVLPRESARNLPYLVIVFPAVILALRSLLSYLRSRRGFTR